MTIMSKTRGEQTSTATIETGVSNISSILVRTDNTNAATLTVYDNTSAAGKVVFQATVAGATGQTLFPFESPVRMENGIHAVVSGTGASYFIYTV